MGSLSDGEHREWMQGRSRSNFLEEAIQRLRYKHSWTKDDLCRYLDIKPNELHRYLKGEATPPESFLLIIKSELERAGGFERRGKVRPIELLDRIIELERRVEWLEEELKASRSGPGGSPDSPAEEGPPAD